MHSLLSPRARFSTSSKSRCSSSSSSRSLTLHPACRCQAASSAASTVATLQAIDLTPETFEPFGQVIEPTADGKAFDAADAQLVLDKGTPRFYIMNLPRRGLSFSRITYHANVTQCLGGLNPPKPWYIVVAAPTASVQDYPKQDQLTAFKVPHGTAIKFKQGTWHAGPLFDDSDEMSFYNLELSDTNVVDHNTHDYSASDDKTFNVLEC